MHHAQAVCSQNPHKALASDGSKVAILAIHSTQLSPRAFTGLPIILPLKTSPPPRHTHLSWAKTVMFKTIEQGHVGTPVFNCGQVLKAKQREQVRNFAWPANIHRAQDPQVLEQGKHHAQASAFGFQLSAFSIAWLTVFAVPKNNSNADVRAKVLGASLLLYSPQSPSLQNH